MLAAITIFGVDIGAVATFLAAIVAIAVGINGFRGKRLQTRLAALELARGEAETYKATIVERDKTIAERDHEITRLKAEHAAEVQQLRLALAERDKDIASLKGRLDQFEKFVTSPQAVLEAMRSMNELMVQGFGSVTKEMAKLQKEMAGLRRDLSKSA